MSRNIQFLRNTAPLATKAEALAKLNTVLGGQADGAPAIVSYGDATNGYAALFGFKYANGVQMFEGIKYTVPEGGGDPVVEVPEEVKKAIEDAITDIKGGASEGFDTLKEVEDVIKEVISGSGLNADGTYTAPADSTYVSGTTSIVGAIDKLDEALKGVSDASDAIKLVELTAEEVTALADANVQTAYKLVGSNAVTAKGVVIKINKDRHLESVAYADQKLTFTYVLADGSKSVVEVPMAELITESEFGAGIEVVDGKAQIKLDTTSEGFLTVGADGIKVSGVQDAIDTAVQNANDAIDAYTVNGMAISGNPVVDGSNAKLSTAYTEATAATAVAAEDTIDIAFGKLAKSVKDLNDELNGSGSTGEKVYLTEVEGSDAIAVSTKAQNKQTISLKIKANDPMFEINADNGLQTKADFVLDAGTYE